MADIHSTPMRRLRERLLPPLEEDGGRVWRWVAFSSVLHLLFIWSLFITPPVPSRRGPSYPVYTVDLVGGEKLGGTKLGSIVEPLPPAKKSIEKAKAEPAARIEPAKKEKAKVKVAESPALMREKTALKQSKKEAKTEPRAEAGLPGPGWGKLIQIEGKGEGESGGKSCSDAGEDCSQAVQERGENRAAGGSGASRAGTGEANSIGLGPGERSSRGGTEKTKRRWDQLRARGRGG